MIAFKQNYCQLRAIKAEHARRKGDTDRHFCVFRAGKLITYSSRPAIIELIFPALFSPNIPLHVR